MKKRSSEKRKISFREKSTRRGIARREEIFYEDASVRGYDDLWQADYRDAAVLASTEVITTYSPSLIG